MRSLPNDTRRVGLMLVTGVAIAALLSIWQAPAPAAGTSEVDRARDRLARHRSELSEMKAELAATRRASSRARREHARALRRYGDRMASIYKAGGTSTVGVLLTGAESLGDAGDRLRVVNDVARTDRTTLNRFEAAAQKVPALERKAADLQRRIALMRVAIRNDRASIAAARRRAEAAAAAARALARKKESPLVASVTSPESVAQGVARSESSAHAAPVKPRPTPTVGSHSTQSSAGSSGGAATSAGGSGNDDDGSDNSAGSSSAPGYSESGLASTYHANLAGKPTASGEPYDPGAMTCAHKSLPLGTWITVVGPRGSVVVRVNDRGPFVGGRIVDLSQAAANALGMTGLTQVTIRVNR